MNSSFFIRELPIILSIAVLLATLILYLLYLRKRKQNQRLLESNRDLLRSINKNISEGLYRTTPSGQFLYVNNALARLAGFSSPEEMMKVNVKDLYVKPERRRHLQQLVAEKGHIENEDVEFYKKDGTVFWAMISTTGVRDSMGNIEFYDGVISDISQRREIVEKLLESEERYRTLIETMSEGLVCVNNEDHLQFANHKFFEMIGYTKQELLGKPLMDIIVNPE
ncbi:MAG: PAS domain S-box protein, partial [Bacteroidia bacterium]|nr:PAS domain S-box protein [Bacteroidia bacterium]